MLIYDGSIYFSYFYFLIQRKKFSRIFVNWKQVSNGLRFRDDDKGLMRTSKLLSGVVFLSTLFGVALYQAQLLPLLPRTPGTVT
jgi:hypothetical protein